MDGFNRFVIALRRRHWLVWVVAALVLLFALVNWVIGPAILTGSATNAPQTAGPGASSVGIPLAASEQRRILPEATRSPNAVAPDTTQATRTIGHSPAVEKISRFGEYSGYSSQIYDGWTSASQYITMRDGVRIAIEINRPTLNGEPVEDKLPVVWTHSRYHRNGYDDNGKVMSSIDPSPELQTLVRTGYVFAAADVRGAGASFGRQEGLLAKSETQDAYEITEWLAAQPWSNGKVGMWGASYLGMTQYKAASQNPPHLVAIFPQFAAYNLYDTIYPGGIFSRGFVYQWAGVVKWLDTESPAPGVDGDTDGALLKQAISEHRDNWDAYTASLAEPFYSTGPSSLYYEAGAGNFIDQINQSDVAIYHFGGFMDCFARDTLLYYANTTRPQKMLMGPFSHNSPGPAQLAEFQRIEGAEMRRWFDHWLKGIDNGVMAEDPINYATYTGDGGWYWQSAKGWPPAGTVETTFALLGGEEAGLLSEQSAGRSGFDTLPYDPTVTLGDNNRWMNCTGIPLAYPNLAVHDSKGLSYTTPPLADSLTITGSPVVTLYVTSTETDGDFHVTLEMVDKDGKSKYISEGELRASHGKLSTPSFNILGLPYHSHLEADSNLRLSPETPTALTFDMQPTSVVFPAGSRIRVTITSADAGTFENLSFDTAPEIKVYHSDQYPSEIILPVIR